MNLFFWWDFEEIYDKQGLLPSLIHALPLFPEFEFLSEPLQSSLGNLDFFGALLPHSQSNSQTSRFIVPGNPNAHLNTPSTTNPSSLLNKRHSADHQDWVVNVNLKITQEQTHKLTSHYPPADTKHRNVNSSTLQTINWLCVSLFTYDTILDPGNWTFR